MEDQIPSRRMCREEKLHEETRVFIRIRVPEKAHYFLSGAVIFHGPHLLKKGSISAPTKLCFLNTFYYFFLKIYLNCYVHMCFICMLFIYVHHVCAWYPWSQNKTLDSLKLIFQIVVSHSLVPETRTLLQVLILGHLSSIQHIQLLLTNRTALRTNFTTPQ